MEAQCGGANASGEMRKIHIIYFLSRNGRTEHPHLIKVHHLSKNGVRLRGTYIISLLIFTEYFWLIVALLMCNESYGFLS